MDAGGRLVARVPVDQVGRVGELLRGLLDARTLATLAGLVDHLAHRAPDETTRGLVVELVDAIVTPRPPGVRDAVLPDIR